MNQSISRVLPVFAFAALMVVIIRTVVVTSRKETFVENERVDAFISNAQREPTANEMSQLNAMTDTAFASWLKTFARPTVATMGPKSKDNAPAPVPHDGASYDVAAEAYLKVFGMRPSRVTVSYILQEIPNPTEANVEAFLKTLPQYGKYVSSRLNLNGTDPPIDWTSPEGTLVGSVYSGNAESAAASAASAAAQGGGAGPGKYKIDDSSVIKPANLEDTAYLSKPVDASTLRDTTGPVDPNDPNFYMLDSAASWTFPGRYHKACPNEVTDPTQTVEYCPTVRYKGWDPSIAQSGNVGTLLEDVKLAARPGSVLQPGKWVRKVQRLVQ